jgi:diguanylate cyclase (GGDEF)-like protein
MMRFNQSLRTRLSLSIAALVMIIITLSVIATTSMITIDHRVEAVDQKWLASTHLLGEWTDRISEFRLAETYRALATDANSRVAAEELAGEQRRAISELQAEYVKLHDGNILDLVPLRTAWNAYFVEHDAWVKADPDGLHNDQAQRDSRLHHLYKLADNAIDRIVQLNMSAAHAEADYVNRDVDETIALMTAVCGAGIIMATWLMIRVRTNISQPLGAITQALGRLAAGDRNVQVPELNRRDEIGEMAKAFDIFRANALALEQAHEATRAAQEQAQALARHDALTGLPNRRVFSAELEAALGHARNESVTYSVLMIDLDRFKPVNDLQGHAVGDLVLCEVARRLKDVARKNDTVARLGGDEFAIISEAEPHGYPETVIRLAGRVLAAIREPISVGTNRIEIGASIGIASCPADGAEPGNLLRAADIAMYRAKQDGRGKFCFYEQSMDEELRAQAALETDLRSAITQGKIEPYYQPLIDIRDNHIYGFEMLARWQHPERGAIPPDTFIPLAEQLGLIPELTWSLLRQGCRDSREWADDILLSINISPIQLKDPALPTQLLTILNQEGFSPSRLEIEITETALVSDIETAKLILTALQSIGIRISLDDFGTGYSSLYHLRELRFDKIKIDRSFVQSMKENSESEKIVEAILSLAKSLGLPTVAEGIENPDVLRQLAAMGCEFGQGYYFGKAMTAKQAKAMLEVDTKTRKAV